MPNPLMLTAAQLMLQDGDDFKVLCSITILISLRIGQECFENMFNDQESEIKFKDLPQRKTRAGFGSAL